MAIIVGILFTTWPEKGVFSVFLQRKYYFSPANAYMKRGVDYSLKV